MILRAERRASSRCSRSASDVLNIEVIVLWIHRSVIVRRVPREDEPRGAGDGPGHDQDGSDESRIRDLDPRGGGSRELQL